MRQKLETREAKFPGLGASGAACSFNFLSLMDAQSAARHEETIGFSAARAGIAYGRENARERVDKYSEHSFAQAALKQTLRALKMESACKTGLL